MGKHARKRKAKPIVHWKPGTPVQIKVGHELGFDGDIRFNLKSDEIYFITLHTDLTVKIEGYDLGYRAERFELARNLTELEKAIWDIE